MFYEVSIIFLIISWHEIGHFIAAKYYHWNVQRITLWIFGGVMETEEHFNRPMREQFFVTIAGPLQHILIFILILIIEKAGWLMPDLIRFSYGYNGLILLFNLLPIWPLDGGKLLNMSLNCFTPFKKAYQRTLIISLSILFLLVAFMLSFNQALINTFVLFAFLIWENQLEWKRRLYVFQRQLLARMNRKTRAKKMMPLTFTSQTALTDIFNGFYLNRFHLIVVRDRQLMISETDCLTYYYYKGKIDARLDDLIKHETK